LVSTGVESAALGADTAVPRRLTRAQQARQVRRERRLARYREVLALHEQGASQCQIAANLGMGRRTIRRFLRADDFPERAPSPPRASALRPYEAYLHERWTAGCDNAFALWRELQAQGYTGAASTVRQFLARWRPAPGRPGKKGPRPLLPLLSLAQTALPGAPPTAPASPTPPLHVVHPYSPRQTAWLLLRAQDEEQGIHTARTDPLTNDERAYVTALRQTCPAVAQLQEVAGAFRMLVRRHDAPALARWLAQADQSPFPEIHGFAAGLRADRAAVEAGLTLLWSQGQVEGQVNRLKTLKRAMFGRAHFDLLRLRVLRVA
jgi:transposase